MFVTIWLAKEAYSPHISQKLHLNFSNNFVLDRQDKIVLKVNKNRTVA